MTQLRFNVILQSQNYKYFLKKLQKFLLVQTIQTKIYASKYKQFAEFDFVFHKKTLSCCVKVSEDG